MAELTAAGSIDTVAHLIQVALTPVFLLSAVGTLLNVFNTRVSRVSDHIEHTTDLLAKDPDGPGAALLQAHLMRLGKRTLALDLSIGLTALSGAATCAAAFTLFVGALRDQQGGVALVVLFGVALGCLIGALAAFLGDSVLAWHGLKREGAMPHPGKPAA